MATTQPTKTDSNALDPGDGPAVRSGWLGGRFAVRGRAAHRGVMTLLLLGILLAGWLAVSVVPFPAGHSMVLMTWGACVLGVIAGRLAAWKLMHLGVGAESYLMATLARPVFPLTLYLVLMTAGSPWEDIPFAITLLIIYPLVLLVDTTTTVHLLEETYHEPPRRQTV